MNLIDDPWMPAVTTAGARLIRPAEIADPTVIRLAFPRADLDAAATEWLIGIVATTFAPADEPAWRTMKQPTVDDLDQAFATIAPGFDIERAWQEHSLGGEPVAVENLLAECEGDKAEREGVDLMMRVGTVQAMSPAMAIVSLMALQAYAPEGGSAPNETGKREGYFASIRGGGPLTTLVVPESDLWSMIWANVECGPVFEPMTALPWMTPGDGLITPDNAHHCTLYFATPRRVRLIIDNNVDGIACDLSGDVPSQIVRQIVRVSGGRRFAGWFHPLTPYKLNPTGERSPRRGGIARIGMRDFLGLVASDETKTRIPARTVTNYRVHRAGGGASFRILARGYATSQASVSAWQSADMPVMSGDAEVIEEMDVLARDLVDATDAAAYQLQRAILACKPRVGGAVDRFWSAIEPAFFEALARVPPNMPDDTDIDPTGPIREAWATSMRREAMAIARAELPIDKKPGETARALRELGFALTGYGKAGKKLFSILKISTPKAEAA